MDTMQNEISDGYGQIKDKLKACIRMYKQGMMEEYCIEQLGFKGDQKIEEIIY